MSWMNQLYKTYEANIGKKYDDKWKLSPIAHTNKEAQIEVQINEEGEFQYAWKLENNYDAITLIPVTEDSCGRGNDDAPHALCDTLPYVAGDFSKYCSSDKDKENSEKKFKIYIENLQKWNDSKYTHPKVRAINKYLQKRSLISDLIKLSILKVDEAKKFVNEKINKKTYDKLLVRFRVVHFGNVNSDKTWEDETLIQAYINYYLFLLQDRKKDFCYLEGKVDYISTKHPKGVVSANYGSKLISSNDDDGYTYRGRFQTSEQAFSISYDASQKIHSALTWLAKKQGVYLSSKNKNRIFICWNPNGKIIPNILDMFSGMSDEQETDSNDLYKSKLMKFFKGYIEQYSDCDDIIVISLEAATRGRLSITYYNEFSAKDFWKKILAWGDTCKWYNSKFSEKIYTPSFYRILQCAYGIENKNTISVDAFKLCEQTQRLVKCMIDNQKMPIDIVRALTNKASTPLSYSEKNREYLLSTTCAVIVKYYYDHKILMKEGKDYMKLDMENRDRSYLFGRLLAVYERVERSTYDREEKREPNAIRLQSAYVNHPMQTWKILHVVLNPYFQKLKPGSREYYNRIIIEITEKIREEDEKILNQGLKESYLLGYYLQRAELNKKNVNNEEEKDNE